MKVLKIDELKEEKICPSEYQFGTSDKWVKSICAVRVPFLCNFLNNDTTVTFNTRLDVIDGDLPFMIGLPPLLAIKRKIDFKSGSLSLLICNVTYPLQLIHQFQHLRLSILCNVTHQ